MAHELQSLGGGDATLGTFDVHAVIDDHVDDNKGRSAIGNKNDVYKQEARVLWVHGKTIGIRDVTQPRSRPSAEVMTYTDVTSSMRLHSLLTDRTTLYHKSNSVADWVLHGYNACLISYGPRDIGKSLVFFGPHSKSPPSIERLNPCLCHSILLNLYEKGGSSPHITANSLAWLRPA